MRKIALLGLLLIFSGTAIQPIEAKTPAKSKKHRKGVLKAAPQVVVDFVPKKAVVNATPGDKILVKLKARNSTKDDVRAIVQIKDFHFLENGKFNYEKINKGEVGPYSLVPYAKALTPKFMLKAGETKETIIQVDLPKDMKGSKGLLMSVRTDPEWIKETKKVKRKTGIQFSVAYTGPLIVNLKDNSSLNLLADNKVDYNKKTKSLKTNSFIHLKGNAFLMDLEGQFLVLDKNNKNILKGNLKNTSDQPTIYPENKRKYSGGSEIDLKKGDYTLVISYYSRNYGFTKTYKEKFSVK